MSFGKLASTFVLVSTAFYVLGCSPDCRLVCERLEEGDCPYANDNIDCEYYCKHQQDLVTNADCQEDWDAYLLCLDELENVCDSFPEPCKGGEDCDDPKCDNEAEDVSECIAEYCQDNPRNNECMEIFGGK